VFALRGARKAALLGERHHIPELSDFHSLSL
jgi:hypothetical protein